ncbi:neuroligin-4, X-linked [Dermacentor silvarum]|uniref:neuroligin-4, X-linked n=1 Tax=Dermacentor silvarum TaxID=543639 RepID=UPI001897CAD1|nr:neuroligin-4, X-linked [Dermacentor silvarum]
MCNNSYCTGLTVVVFIHGGGLRAGGNADRLHEGSVLAAQGQVVVVVPNYRLGVLGFPSRDIVGAARNPGLLDLAMALGWVRESITAFGGNAKNVVLFGSGWGAYLAGLFLVSPKLRSYFATFRIILGSGSPLLKSSHEHQTEEHWNGFLSAAGCGDADENATLECLRNATASSLAVAQDQFPGAVGVLFPDDFVLPEPPAEFVAEVRTYSSVEVLLTNVVSEGRAEYQRLFENNPNGTDLSVESLMSMVGLAASQLAYQNHVELQAAVSNLYKEYGARRGGVGAEFLGDVRYNCPSVLFAKRLCRGRARVVHLLIAEPATAGHASATFSCSTENS